MGTTLLLLMLTVDDECDGDWKLWQQQQCTLIGSTDGAKSKCNALLMGCNF